MVFILFVLCETPYSVLPMNAKAIHLKTLSSLLSAYALRDAQTATLVSDFQSLLKDYGDRAFFRTQLPGHFTASTWLLSPTSQEVLLTHHRKLDMWVQLGGHCDGESDVTRVALKEAREESGIADIELIDSQLFDIDKHKIPARPNESEHFHYDLRFLARASHYDFKVSSESKSLKWFRFDDPFFNGNLDSSVRRMWLKWTKSLVGIERKAHLRDSKLLSSTQAIE